MDIRLDDSYIPIYQELMKLHGEKTRPGLARLLIRDAAKEAGLWGKQGDPEPTDSTSESDPQAVQAQP